ncbi:MAG: hypothetical protein AVDCRST_MAG93-8620 [uncultured Chloroflexia bacterium]|uniref:Uncharacterized protein n=1 Tax=uncultured Chloroflexia bacterium TaxID=1672391 RepID=A0A6J4N012_9CHLR|nr:MAG: hypothetical protein AVDCRST_MAG93-8620 [uncultured Chloroflexia bacterium]
MTLPVLVPHGAAGTNAVGTMDTGIRCSAHVDESSVRE